MFSCGVARASAWDTNLERLALQGTAQTDSTTFEMEDFSAMGVDSDKVRRRIFDYIDAGTAMLPQTAQALAGCTVSNETEVIVTHRPLGRAQYAIRHQ